jgi:hypothetical protein
MTNDATMREKKRQLREDRLPTTFHAQAQLGSKLEDLPSSRIFSGSQEHSPVPFQDSTSPWSGGGAQVPPEPPTNEDINAVEAVGTYEEIQRSIEALKAKSDGNQTE